MDLTPLCHLRWNVKYASLVLLYTVLTLTHEHAAHRIKPKGGELEA